MLGILRDHFASQEERDHQNAHEVTAELREIKDTLSVYLDRQGSTQNAILQALERQGKTQAVIMEGIGNQERTQTIILEAIVRQECTQTALLQTQNAMLQALERQVDPVSYFKVHC
jgi:hypothetical protein